MKKIPQTLTATVLLTAAITVLLPANGASNQETALSNETCITCHEEYDTSLGGTVHDQAATDAPRPVHCTDCHTGGSLHSEEPARENIGNPSTQAAEAVAEICRGCHFTDHQQHMSERNVHFTNNISCSACHSVHNNKNQFYLLKDRESELCYRCHQQVRGTFAHPYRHPVPDGIMNCSECHTTLDRVGTELGAGRMSESCYQCHQEMRGPFPYEHQAVVDYSTEEGGCLNCHAAHGSNLPRMLTQPLEQPNYALCAQCHIVPGHQFDNYHGAQWAGRACMECHVDIHGSYDNRFLLKTTLPDEEGQNCFASACHDQ